MAREMEVNDSEVGFCHLSASTSLQALPALPSSPPPSPLLSRFLSCDLIRLIPAPGPLHFLPGQLLHGQLLLPIQMSVSMPLPSSLPSLPYLSSPPLLSTPLLFPS